MIEPLLEMLQDYDIYYSPVTRERKIEMPESEAKRIQDKIAEMQKEIDKQRHIIDTEAEEILKELKENNHLSCGVALAIRQRLIDYREIKQYEKSEETIRTL